MLLEQDQANAAIAASSKPYTHSAETRAKISAAAKGRKHSPEARAKIAAAGTGRKHSPETRVKMSAAQKGRKLSPEHCAKMSAARKGCKPSPETRANMAAAQRGRKHSPETLAKMSTAQKGRKHSPETLAKLRNDLTGKTFGKWHVIELAGRRRGSTMYKCFCECNPAMHHLIQACHLVNGESAQCRFCSYKESSINAFQSEGRVRGLNKILSNAKHRLTDVQVILMPFIGETAKANCKECGEVPARRKSAGKWQCYIATVPGARVRYKNQAWQALVSQLEQRQGKCANPACDNPILFAQVKGKSCHLDHDDDTGYFCGWLCPTCNPGIGYFGHDPGRIEGAAEYVRQTRFYVPLPTPEYAMPVDA